jgi:hypothetical protein
MLEPAGPEKQKANSKERCVDGKMPIRAAYKMMLSPPTQNNVLSISFGWFETPYVHCQLTEYQHGLLYVAAEVLANAHNAVVSAPVDVYDWTYSVAKSKEMEVGWETIVREKDVVIISVFNGQKWKTDFIEGLVHEIVRRHNSIMTKLLTDLQTTKDMT